MKKKKEIEELKKSLSELIKKLNDPNAGLVLKAGKMATVYKNWQKIKNTAKLAKSVINSTVKKFNSDNEQLVKKIKNVLINAIMIKIEQKCNF